MQSRSIVGVVQVTTQGVKKPERRVGGVIKTFLLPIREHVWDEPVADVMGECSQNISGLQTTTGDKAETFQRNHGVASPVGEPMITGDDSSHVVTRSMRTGGFLKTTSRRDDELVAGKNELGRKFTTRLRRRIIQHFRAPFFFRRKR